MVQKYIHKYFDYIIGMDFPKLILFAINVIKVSLNFPPVLLYITLVLIKGYFKFLWREIYYFNHQIILSSRSISKILLWEFQNMSNYICQLKQKQITCTLNLIRITRYQELGINIIKKSNMLNILKYLIFVTSLFATQH